MYEIVRNADITDMLYRRKQLAVLDLMQIVGGYTLADLIRAATRARDKAFVEPEDAYQPIKLGQNTYILRTSCVYWLKKIARHQKGILEPTNQDILDLAASQELIFTASELNDTMIIYVD